MNNISHKSLLLPFLNLFTSFSTIICCALPALLVTIGAGATLAGLVTTVPQLIVISKYKEVIFLGAGILIILTGTYQWKMKSTPCPSDPELAKTCLRIRKINKIVYFFSVFLYVIGFFFAFIAVKVL